MNVILREVNEGFVSSILLKEKREKRNEKRETRDAGHDYADDVGAKVLLSMMHDALKYNRS